MSETLLFAIVLIPSLVIAIVFHEVAHGMVAYWLGDPTASERNRLSLNPLRHVDPVGTLLVPGMLALASGPIFGWAKPVPVNAARLSHPFFGPRYGMMLVAIAGPGTNFILAAIGAVALGLLRRGGVPTEGFNGFGDASLQLFVVINVFLGMFNLLPIPPFDGSHIVEGLLPRRWVHHYARLRPYGMLAFIALVMLTWFAPELGVLENTIGPPVNWAREQYFNLAGAVAGE